MSSKVSARRQYTSRTRMDAIFLWIPKTAGTFFYRHLAEQAGCPKLKDLKRLANHEPLSGVVTFGHMHIPALLASGSLSQDFYDRAFVFAFVRNPYARAVSNYEYQKQGGRIPPEMSFETFCHLLVHDGVTPVGLYNWKSLSQCNPQVTWLRDTRVDCIGRVEDFQDSAELICRRLTIPPPADFGTKVNRSIYADHASYLSPVTIRHINSFYREDFDQLGYEMMSS